MLLIQKAAPKKKAAPEIHEEEEDKPVEIKKLAIPRYSPAQLAAKAKKEGDAPDIVKDEITKVTLFDYSDIFADEEDDDEEELSSFIFLPQEVQDTAINAAQKAAAINLLVTDIILTP